MDDIILQTKLHIPASPPALVPRPRLIQVLNAAHADRLTLISAPAGFGKTTLATTWLRQQNAAVAWLSLDAHDNDLHRFLTYLTAAVHGALPAFEPEQRLPPADPDPAVEPLLTSLINQLAAHNRQVILVLDDYHLITANEVHAALSFLLDNAPSTLHVLLTTRADPPLPLARLRARGHLTELRAADLMFSPEETTVLLNGRHALDLSTPDLHVLNNRTEGWAAALQLAVLSLQRLPPPATISSPTSPATTATSSTTSSPRSCSSRRRSAKSFCCRPAF